jgi:coproporphyrinogen III oxidase
MVAGCGEIRHVVNAGQLVEHKGVRTSAAGEDIVTCPRKARNSGASAVASWATGTSIAIAASMCVG